MERVLISVAGAAPPGLPFSPGLQVGSWVFLSGQGSISSDNEILGGTIEEQTEMTLQNVERLLRAARCELSDVVSVLVHLSDLTLFERYNRVYERFFPDPKPVRTTVGAQLLGGLLVEMTVTARVPPEPTSS
jgi:2-iminobutanoate/2-iminopropanoate deaminase